MKIQTFSVVVGTSACQANCPFCVSHTTGFEALPETKKINHSRLENAIQLARVSGCTTLLFTGKGEPTLYPDELTKYMMELGDFRQKYGFFFPFVELQTNALEMGEIANLISNATLNRQFDFPSDFHSWVLDDLSKNGGDFIKNNARLIKLLNAMGIWRDKGMSTIAISTVGINKEHNKQVYLHHRKVEYPDLSRTVKFLHQMGFSTRLCVMMQRDMVDSFDKLNEVAKWCKENEVAQLTARPIRRPLLPVLNSDDYTNYIETRGLDKNTIETIQNMVEKSGTHIMTLMHGQHKAKVYDLFGQNLCLSDCLTVSPESDDIRTLIFYSDGKMFYDWSFLGARLI